jgi:hypothetical protein
VTGVEVGVGLAWPRRLPLWDYSTDPETRKSYDFARVLDLSVSTVSDRAAPADVVVVCDLRLAWSRETTIRPERVTATELRVIARPT